jgi:hypothetical protein
VTGHIVGFANRSAVAALVALGVATSAVPLRAQEGTGPTQHSMLGKMPAEDWYPFVAGMIEGVAFHRYTAAGKDADLMNCIYDWFYKEDGALKAIYAALNEFPDYPPASVVNALAKRKCGGE